MRNACWLPFFKMTEVDGAGSPVVCYTISQFYISILSDSGGSKNMHSAIVRNSVKKVLQPVIVVHVKDLIFEFPKFCEIFLQLRYAVE